MKHSPASDFFGNVVIDILDGSCLFCGSDKRELIRTGLTDIECRVPGTYSIARCRACSGIYLSRRPSPASLPDCYPTNYYTRTRKNLGRVKSLLFELRYMLRWRRLRPLLPHTATSILEIGCGDAGFLRFVEPRLEPRARLCGLDLHIDRSSLPSGSRVRLSEGDITNTLFPGQFDLILLYETLEHVASPIETLKAVTSHMAPGAYLVGTVPCWGSLWHRVFPRHWSGLQIPRHQSFFSRGTLGKVLGDAGLELETIRPVFDPGDMSVSLCNWITETFGLKTFPRQAWFFLPITILGAPLVWLHTIIFRASGDIEFVARLGVPSSMHDRPVSSSTRLPL